MFVDSIQRANRLCDCFSDIIEETIQRPTLIVSDYNTPEPITQRAQNLEGGIIDFDKYQFNKIERPGPGAHLASEVSPYALPHIKIKVGWDTCAEATTMSDVCATRILRAQEPLLTRKMKVALHDLGRFDPPQRIKGFAGGEGIKVNVAAKFLLGGGPGALGSEFGDLQVRIVKGQTDDLLVGWPDLFRIGCDFFYQSRICHVF